MPKRSDISSVLLIGSGPIVIGQACEFDYSGTQAIKALKDEGIRVVLVNSNPATIMTDPEFADRTYIEPITPVHVERIIAKERPDAVLPTMGGQTALNCALELQEMGVFEKYGCQLIGADVQAIKTAEDRELFRVAMDEIGLASARSGIVCSVADAEALAKQIGFPMILRPSRTLGGTGGGIVERVEQLVPMVSRALQCSPNHEVLIEESLLGWKEIELEVMRDKKDNVVIICGIENIDPMGVHTGDSITVSPIQTLTDKEYQVLRDAAIKVIRRVGVETGGSNVQFAINPEDGRVIVIEMNPRVSRSSALASKATGFPIAKIAAKLALGYTLDEISNDITKETPACFEPSIDYVVVKIPRFTFEKFPMSEDRLGTQMKSVGEVLSFGRCFAEAFQKALSSMELSFHSLEGNKLYQQLGTDELLEEIGKPSSQRLWYLTQALRAGASVEAVYDACKIDTWFLEEIADLIAIEEKIKSRNYADISADEWRELKRVGFSDKRLAELLGCSQAEVESARTKQGVFPNFKAVDTCAAEFQAFTPYFYSSYDQDSEGAPTDRKKVIILGSGPNRIGQGIEFDYCCVHAVMAAREAGYEAIMLNCNPETVSTDYDTSDRLYFEPLNLESVLNVVHRERPVGVIVQFGGQTPLKLAAALKDRGVPILGTSVSSIESAEDREFFSDLVTRLGFRQPEFQLARTFDEAVERGSRLGYPIMIRPSFVLGGRAMKIVFNDDELKAYMEESVDVSEDRPVLMDRFLNRAIELDVDAVSDGDDVVIAGVMEHIEPAGIHSGDSSCCLPPHTLSQDVIDEVKEQAVSLARALKVVGLLNVQFAISNGDIYIIEANPRASRTVPFVSKATGIPWAKIAARTMLGEKLRDMKLPDGLTLPYYSVKACVFPFKKFSGVDTILGPEMKSTGEVMGIGRSFPAAFAKSQFGAGVKLPEDGTVFMSIRDADKPQSVDLAKGLLRLGYKIIATRGTAKFLEDTGIEVGVVNKVRDGGTHIVDKLGLGEVQLVINTPEDGGGTFLDSRSIRLVANELDVPCYTTIAAAHACVEALASLKVESGGIQVGALQEYHTELPGAKL
jgi:carbamoyl-phosphate synthase large subunit